MGPLCRGSPLTFSTVLVQVVAGLPSFRPYFFLPPLLPPSEPRSIIFHRWPPALHRLSPPGWVRMQPAGLCSGTAHPGWTRERSHSTRSHQPQEQTRRDERLPPAPSAPRGCRPQAQTEVFVSKNCHEQGSCLTVRVQKQGCAVLAWQQGA